MLNDYHVQSVRAVENAIMRLPGFDSFCLRTSNDNCRRPVSASNFWHAQPPPPQALDEGGSAGRGLGEDLAYECWDEPVLVDGITTAGRLQRCLALEKVENRRCRVARKQ